MYLILIIIFFLLGIILSGNILSVLKYYFPNLRLFCTLGFHLTPKAITYNILDKITHGPCPRCCKEVWKDKEGNWNTYIK